MNYEFIDNNIDRGLNIDLKFSNIFIPGISLDQDNFMIFGGLGSIVLN